MFKLETSIFFKNKMLWNWIWERNMNDSTLPNFKFRFSSIKSINTKYFRAFQSSKVCQFKNTLFLWILLEKLRISNFEMRRWDVSFEYFFRVMSTIFFKKKISWNWIRGQCHTHHRGCSFLHALSFLPTCFSADLPQFCYINQNHFSYFIHA